SSSQAQTAEESPPGQTAMVPPANRASPAMSAAKAPASSSSNPARGGWSPAGRIKSRCTRSRADCARSPIGSGVLLKLRAMERFQQRGRPDVVSGLPGIYSRLKSLEQNVRAGQIRATGFFVIPERIGPADRKRSAQFRVNSDQESVSKKKKPGTSVDRSAGLPEH